MDRAKLVDAGIFFGVPFLTAALMEFAPWWVWLPANFLGWLIWWATAKQLYLAKFPPKAAPERRF